MLNCRSGSVMSCFFVVSMRSLISILCIFLLIRSHVAVGQPKDVQSHGNENTECIRYGEAWPLLQFNLDTTRTAPGRSLQINVNETTMSFLRSIPSRLSVLSIIGAYRTAKSSLLNQLLPDNFPTNVFSVGHTVQPHTEDVSIYYIPACHFLSTLFDETAQKHDNPFKGDRHTGLLIVDTPGLFAPNRIDLFDAQLLAILNVMSSVVIYNSLGVVKRGEIEELSDAIESAITLSFFTDEETDKKGTSGSSSNSSINRPHLIWTMQNLEVELRDARNQQISPLEYIQSTLTTIDKSSNFTTNYRQEFNRFFNSIDAVALPFPTKQISDLNRLHELSDVELNKEYVVALNGLRNKLQNALTAKQFGSTYLIGAALESFIRTWIENINIPSPEFKRTSASVLISSINEKEIRKIIDTFKSYFKAPNLVYPVAARDLENIRFKAQKAALSFVNEEDFPDFVSACKDQMDALYESYVEKNEAKIRHRLENAYGSVLRRSYDRKKSWSYPSSQSSIFELKKELEKDSRETFAAVPVSPRIDVSVYESKMKDTIDGLITNMLHVSLDEYTKVLTAEGDKELNKIELPVDEADIEKVLHAIQAKWQDILAEMSTLTTGAKNSYDARILHHLLDRHDKLSADNLLASLGQCEKEARQIVEKLLLASADWMNDERFRSYATVDELTARHSHRSFCSGPATNSSHVAIQFHRLQKDLHQRIAFRVSNARILLLLSLIFGLVSFLRLRNLLTTSERKTVHWYDYTFGWVAFISLALQVAISRLIPDATMNTYLFLFYLTLAFLCFTVVISIVLTCRRWKPKAQRIWSAHDN